jgi:hypothetical protein
MFTQARRKIFRPLIVGGSLWLALALAWPVAATADVHRVPRRDLPAWIDSWTEEDHGAFRLYYPDDAYRDEARRLTNIGQRVFAELAGTLPHPMLGQISLLAFPDPADFGRATGILELQTPAAARGEPPTIFLNLQRLRSQTVRQREQMFAHELAHVFIGRHVETRLPLWLEEGIAQAVAGESADDFSLVAARAFGNLPRLRDLADGFPAEGPSRQLAYALSRAVVDYIVIKDHPVEGLGGLLRDLADDKTGAALVEIYQSTLVMENLQRGWERQTSVGYIILRLLANEQTQWVLIVGLFVAAYAVVKVKRRRQLAEMEAEEARPAESFGNFVQGPIWTPSTASESSSQTENYIEARDGAEPDSSRSD